MDEYLKIEEIRELGNFKEGTTKRKIRNELRRRGLTPFEMGDGLVVLKAQFNAVITGEKNKPMKESKVKFL